MFETQALVNRFPADTAIREDKSSSGFKLFSIMGDINTQFRKDLVRLRLDSRLSSSNTTYLTDVHEFDISDFEFNIDPSSSTIGDLDVTGDATDLTKVEQVDDLLSQLPTGFELIDSSTIRHTIYSSDFSVSGTISDIDIPSRLFIDVQDVTTFISTNTARERSPALYVTLTLIGEDLYGNSLTESMRLTTNGIYRTQNIFAKLLDFTLTNTPETGSIDIKILDVELSELESAYYRYVDANGKSSTLLYSFDEDFFYFKYYIFPFLGEERPSSQKDTVTGIQLLYSDAAIEIDDVTFDPGYEYLYVLSGNKVYIKKNFMLPVMDAPEEQRDLRIALNCDFDNQYPQLNTDIEMRLYMAVLEINVKHVLIKLTDPTGEVFYWDGSAWGSDEAVIYGEETDQPGDTFKDLRISATADILGKWELCVIATSMKDLTYKTVKNFFVPSLEMDQVIDLDSSYEWIAYHDDGFVYLGNGTTVDRFRPVYDYYFFDKNNGYIYTLESYESLVVENA